MMYSSNFNCMNAIYNIKQVSTESNEFLKKKAEQYKYNANWKRYPISFWCLQLV